MNKLSFAIGLLCLAVAGCGGGKGNTNKLYTLRTGATWLYAVSGTVNSNSLQAGSTLTVSVPAGTVKDLNGQDVNILDRKYDLIRPDGVHIYANQRLYWSQSATGIFIHGVNFSSGTTFSQANDVFVPGTANPPFKFLMVSDPAVNGLTIQYIQPFGPGTATLYSLALGNTEQQVTVPAGTFIAKGMTESEQFKNTTTADVALTSAAFAPNVGVLGGQINARFPDGSLLAGNILLKQFNL